MRQLGGSRIIPPGLGQVLTLDKCISVLWFPIPSKGNAMNLETKRNSSRLCSRTISIQGTPSFSVLSCPHGTLNSGDGAREAQPMIRYSRQLGTYVRGWGDALHPWAIRTCCTERASLAWMGLVPGSGVGREPGALLGRSYQPRSSCVFTWGHAREE